ncbi:MAG: hypothetical protein V4485_02075 [Pseudomonadota bacterium]
MIRKILLALFLLYSAIWLSIAYLLKQEISNFITKKSDQVIVSYKDLQFSGFPNKWQFTFQNPVIEVNSRDSIQIFSSPFFGVAFNLGLNVIKLIPSLETLVEVKTNDIPILYKINLNSIPKIKSKLHYPLFWKDSAEIDTISVAIPSIILSADQEIMDLSDLELSIKSTISGKDESLNIRASGEYEGLKEVFGVDFLQFELAGDLGYYVDEINNKIFMQNIKIDTLDIALEDEVALDVSGKITLKKEWVGTEGRFDVALQNYPELIDRLWPNDLFVSKYDIKRLIDRTMGVGALDAEFVLTLSDKGFMLNDINIIDFYRENENEKNN